MRKILVAAVVFLSFALAGSAQTSTDQSLADVARQVRQQKHAPVKVITNEDLVSPAAQAKAATTAATADAGAAPADDNKADKDAEKAAAAEAAKKKVDALKKDIAQLQHDIDIMQREYKLRTATYYADAGNSLRDPKAWAESDRKYKADLADKQQQLADAKQKLDDALESARKQGIRAE